MKLTEDNFIQFAMKQYDNPQCHSVKEFEEDVKRFLYLKKLLSRYKNDGELRERLILNHIIVLYNVFGKQTTRMLFHKIEYDYWSILITFLVYLNRMPDEIAEFGIVTSNVSLDDRIIRVLRNI